MEGIDPVSDKVVTSVFDRTVQDVKYNADGKVLAYTGEAGEKIFDFYDDQDDDCYKQEDGTVFQLDGNYKGAYGGTYLCYDGHPGVDFTASEDHVIAVESGTVVKMKNDCPDDPPTAPDVKEKGCGGGYGNHVKISHGEGDYLSIYGHLKKGTISVEKGASLVKGARIGTTGNSGASYGEHLHFQLQAATGQPLDPYDFWSPPPASAKFLIGDPVEVTEFGDGVSVRTNPFAKILGKRSSGDKGTVEQGPKWLRPYWWWKVNFEEGPDGWVAQEFVEEATENPLDGEWTARLPYPAEGHRGMLSFTIGNKGYVIGTSYGYPSQEVPGNMWEYGPSTNTWSKKANYPAGGFLFQSPHFVINGKAYLVSTNEVWEYNPSTDRWTRKGDIPGEDKRAGFGFAVNGKGYVGGGFYNSQAFWEYTPSTDQWTRRQDHPTLQTAGEHAVSGVSFIIGNKAYVTGTNMDFWEYDPETDQWVKKAWVHGVYGQTGVVGDTGYVFNAHGELYAYDVATDRWKKSIDYPGAKVCSPIGMSIAGSMYFGLGGVFEENTCTLDFMPELWRFTPSD